MDLRRCYLTNNNCYKKGTKINPVGIVVHSTGANNPYIKRYVQPNDGRLGENMNHNDWNNDSIAVCVHAFLGYDQNKNVCIYETLPYNIACWGCGKGSKGSYNYNPTAHIQFEICEDGLNDKVYFDKAMKEAQEYCAYLCKMYGFGIDKIVDHATACKQGYASNHSDIGHWLSIYGLDLTWFRNCVQEILNPVVVDIDTHDVKIINTDGTLNIRESYSSSSKINGTINDGNVVSVNGSYNGWLRLTDGRGWIFEKYTEKYVKPAEVVTPVEQKTDDISNVTPIVEPIKNEPIVEPIKDNTSKVEDNTQNVETEPIEDKNSAVEENTPSNEQTTTDNKEVDNSTSEKNNTTDSQDSEVKQSIDTAVNDTINNISSNKTGFIAGLTSVLGGIMYLFQNYWFVVLIALIVAIIIYFIIKSRKEK